MGPTRAPLPAVDLVLSGGVWPEVCHRDGWHCHTDCQRSICPGRACLIRASNVNYGLWIKAATRATLRVSKMAVQSTHTCAANMEVRYREQAVPVLPDTKQLWARNIPAGTHGRGVGGSKGVTGDGTRLHCVQSWPRSILSLGSQRAA